MHHRIPRIVGAIALATTLVAGTVGSALSSTAPLEVTGENLSPVVISYGGVGAFHVKATNDPNQTSNISQLYLIENSKALVYGYAAPNPWCSAIGTPLTCSFGSLAPGDSVEFTVALTAPSSGSTWNVDFEFSTNGAAPGKPSRGGGDPTFHYIPDPEPMLVSTSSTSDAAGTYIWDTTQQPNAVHNGLKLGQNNQQSTSVTSPSTQIAVSVQDGDSNPDDLGCTDTADHLCPATFFGQISVVEVGGDELVTDPANCLAPAAWVDASATTTGVSGCAFPVVIQYYRPGINPSQVNGVYHNWTDSTGFHQEWIDNECDGATAPGPVSPCFYPEKLGARDLQITVWLFHNGGMMGW